MKVGPTGTLAQTSPGCVVDVGGWLEVDVVVAGLEVDVVVAGLEVDVLVAGLEVEVLLAAVDEVDVVVVVDVVVGGAAVQGPNSDVLLSGAVAVAVRIVPAGSDWANVTVKSACPLPSVVTASLAPTKDCPSPLPDGSQASLAKTSMRNVVFRVELRVPPTLVPPGKMPARTGKFWRPLAPVSGSPSSFGVRPSGSRSMPRPTFAKIALPAISVPDLVVSTNTAGWKNASLPL